MPGRAVLNVSGEIIIIYHLSSDVIEIYQDMYFQVFKLCCGMK